MKKCLLIILLCLSGHSGYSRVQGQALADSLKLVLTTSKEDTAKVKVLVSLGYNLTYLGRYDETPKYLDTALALSEKLHFVRGKIMVYNNYANNYVGLGNYALALKYYFAELKASEETGNRDYVGYSNGGIGVVYSYQGNYPEAIKYNLKGVESSHAIGDKKNEGVFYINVGEANLSMGNCREALSYFFVALKLEENVGNTFLKAYAYNDIGNAYSKLYESDSTASKFKIPFHQGEQTVSRNALLDSAMALHHMALDSVLWLKDNFNLIYCFSGMAKVYYLKHDYNKAIEYYGKAYTVADTLKALNEKKNMAKELAGCYKKLNDFKSSLYWQEKFMEHKDSLFSDQKSKEQNSVQMNYEFDKKEELTKAEQDKKDTRQRTIRNSIGATLAGTLLFLVVVYRQRNKISKARQRSEELLLNILPEEVAEELKQKGEAEAKQIDEVTVLFTDFKGFTTMSEKLTPKELVRDIHECFSAFDHIMEKYGMEKIKTIGDSYMAAGGLPTANKTHATDAVNAAIEIRQFIEEGKARKIANGEPYFEIRIGIHTGPVVAGIVGVKKFAYDIWGDTVNTASRMESSGEVGQINISETTYDLVKDKFTCEYRGEIEAKNKGKMKMYFVS